MKYKVILFLTQSTKLLTTASTDDYSINSFHYPAYVPSLLKLVAKIASHLPLNLYYFSENAEDKNTYTRP
jgi:hypothetical protein